LSAFRRTRPVTPFNGPTDNPSISIHFDDTAANRFGEHLRGNDGSHAPVAGLLLGSVEHSGSGNSIWIQDFLPLACADSRYASDSFQREAGFLRVMDSALLRWGRSVGKQVYAVGYYRWQYLGALRLEEADAVLFSRFFPEGEAIVLLAQISWGFQIVANAYLPDGSDITRVPARPMLLGDSTISAGEESEAPPTPKMDRPARRRSWSLWVIAAVTLVIAASLTFERPIIQMWSRLTSDGKNLQVVRPPLRLP
jgi:hypothetical protein